MPLGHRTNSAKDQTIQYLDNREDAVTSVTGQHVKARDNPPDVRVEAAASLSRALLFPKSDSQRGINRKAHTTG
jgi:hypothetical protein